MSETLSTRLGDAARRWPDAIAVRHDGRSLRFAALSDQVDRLAGWLRGQGVGRGGRVGIALRRGLNMPVAVYGTLQAEAAYVPIDPQAPAERIHTILNDAGIEIMVAEDALLPRIAEAARGTGLRAVLGVSAAVGEGCDGVPFEAIEAAEPFRGDHGPDDICYIIFTSGSTGIPKGLTHTHASALAFVDMAAVLFDLGPQDRMAATSGLHYDMSCMEMFAGLLSGARIVMVPESYTMLPASLSALLEAEAVTTLYSVPFLLVRLVERGGLEARDLTALRLVIHAGEPMPPRPLAHLRQHLPDSRFTNFYGPAEVNGVTWWDHPRRPLGDHADFPIGWACAHTELLIDAMAGDSDEGELLIATPAMMRGYWGRPDLDARAFAMAGTGDGAKRYYRSGDIVRRDAEGCYTFVGRADRQIKLRGHRVELDEVELAIASHPGVSEAAAVASPDGTTILAAATLAPGASPAPADILEAAAARLARHAVPARIRFVAALPRTSSGKIDRRRLAAQFAQEIEETENDDRG